MGKHGIVTRDSQTKAYSLVGHSDLTSAQHHALIGLCEDKLMAFLAKRGE